MADASNGDTWVLFVEVTMFSKVVSVDLFAVFVCEIELLTVFTSTVPLSTFDILSSTQSESFEDDDMVQEEAR